MNWVAFYLANIKKLQRADKRKGFKGRKSVGQGNHKQKEGLFQARLPSFGWVIGFCEEGYLTSASLEIPDWFKIIFPGKV